MEPETTPDEMQRRFILLYGLRVKILRKARGLSGTEVAIQVQSSFTKLSRLEAGYLKLSPNYHFTLILAQSLGVPPLALLPRGSDYQNGWPTDWNPKLAGGNEDGYPDYITMKDETIPASANLLSRYDQSDLETIRSFIDNQLRDPATDESAMQSSFGMTAAPVRPYVPVQTALDNHLRQSGHTLSVQELKMGLRLCRETRGATLADLSLHTGIEVQQLWDIENRDVSVPTWRVVVLCQALRIDPGLFFPDTVSPRTAYEPARIITAESLNLVLDICMLCASHPKRKKASRMLHILSTIDTLEGIERSINWVLHGILS